MSSSKKKGYRVERKVRKIFEKNGWKVIRAGASLGEADLVCIKNKKCFLIQVKSTKKDKFYYYGELIKKIEGFPLYMVVDFGYGNIIISKPKRIIEKNQLKLESFLQKFNK